MLAPQPLSPGDRIVAVGPSGPFERERMLRGVARLQDRYEWVVAERLGRGAQGFLADSDAMRRAELQAALDDPACRAIWVARGGYGAQRILGGLDFSAARSRPPWLVGFSDATALHRAFHDQGIVSLHAPNLTGVAEAEAGALARLVELLESAKPSSEWHGLEALAGRPWQGSVSGTAFGGNLTVLFAEAAAGRLRVPRGAILLLEDVSETSYRIDRMLTALADAGHFAEIGAIVLGEFTDCSPGKFSVPVAEVLEERLGSLGVPVVRGLAMGHGATNEPWLHGATAELTPNGAGFADLRVGGLY